jgi:hypothetical protein
LATIELSDNRLYEVGPLPNNGNPFTIDLPGEKSIDWMKVTINKADGNNIGLMEVKVFGYPGLGVNSWENLISRARITASTENKTTGQQAVKAADNRYSGYPEHPDNEWASTGESAGAWLLVDWERTHRVRRIILYDRPNTFDQITSATLMFSDGTYVKTGSLPDNANRKLFNFRAREN